MIIERTNNEIIFGFPKNMNLDDLQDLTDLFEYKELTKKSKASQKDVDEGDGNLRVNSSSLRPQRPAVSQTL